MAGSGSMFAVTTMGTNSGLFALNGYSGTEAEELSES
jgi:hypothetical protein